MLLDMHNLRWLRTGMFSSTRWLPACGFLCLAMKETLIRHVCSRF